MLISLPDKLVVFLCLLPFQFCLQSEYSYKVINLSYTVFGKLLVGKDPSGHLIIIKCKQVFALVKLRTCLFQQGIIIPFHRGKFSRRQPFQQLSLPVYRLRLENGLVYKFFNLGIIVVGIVYKIVDGCRIVNSKNCIFGKGLVNSFDFRE